MREILRKSMPIATRVAFATSLRAIFPCLTQVHKWELPIDVSHSKSLQSPGANFRHIPKVNTSKVVMSLKGLCRRTKWSIWAFEQDLFACADSHSRGLRHIRTDLLETPMKISLTSNIHFNSDLIPKNVACTGRQLRTLCNREDSVWCSLCS